MKPNQRRFNKRYGTELASVKIRTCCLVLNIKILFHQVYVLAHLTHLSAFFYIIFVRDGYRTELATVKLGT
jgi:hypothetical protein